MHDDPPPPLHHLVSDRKDPAKRPVDQSGSCLAVASSVSSEGCCYHFIYFLCLIPL